MKLKSGLLSFTAYALASGAYAEPVSLRDVVDHAVSYAPSIAEAEAGLEQGLSGVDAARAKRGPTIGIQAQIGVLETDFTTDHITQNPRQIGLQAEWPVYTSGSLSAGYKAAGLQADAARLSVAGRKEKIVFETVEAYANAWLADRVFEVSEKRTETFRLRRDETNARFEQGYVTRTDTALTEARLASSEAMLEAARASKSAARAKLERYTGLSDVDAIFPTDIDFAPADEFETVLGRVLDENPDYAAAKAMRDASDYRLAEARGRFGPKLSLKGRASASEEAYFFFGDAITDLGAFVTFEMPLYTHGLKAASEREAIAGRSAASAQVRQAELQLREAMSGLWGNMEARKQALAAAERAEKASALAAEGAKKEYDAGLRTLVDSLDAENAYRDAQVERYRAETSLLIVQARILSLASELAERF